MHDTYHVTGTLTNDHTVHLDQTVPLADGPLRIVVEVPAQSGKQPPKESMKDFLARIHAQQKARGHLPRSVEEIAADINEERNSWERE